MLILFYAFRISYCKQHSQMCNGVLSLSISVQHLCARYVRCACMLNEFAYLLYTLSAMPRWSVRHAISYTSASSARYASLAVDILPVTRCLLPASRSSLSLRGYVGRARSLAWWCSSTVACRYHSRQGIAPRTCVCANHCVRKCVYVCTKWLSWKSAISFRLKS